jgi:hypothetical protein
LPGSLDHLSSGREDGASLRLHRAVLKRGLMLQGGAPRIQLRQGSLSLGGFRCVVPVEEPGCVLMHRRPPLVGEGGAFVSDIPPPAMFRLLWAFNSH